MCSFAFVGYFVSGSARLGSCFAGGGGVNSAVQLLPSEAARVFRFEGFVELCLCMVGGIEYMGKGGCREKYGRA